MSFGDFGLLYANSNGKDSSDAYEECVLEEPDDEEEPSEPVEEYEETELLSLFESELLSLSFSISIKLPLLALRSDIGPAPLPWGGSTVLWEFPDRSGGL